MVNKFIGILLICFCLSSCSLLFSQVKYSVPNAAQKFQNDVIEDSSARIWASVRGLNENDVQGFANKFVESMFLWFYENKLKNKEILVLSNPSEDVFQIEVVFTKFENSRTIARAHSPINYFDSNKENWKNKILVDFDKWSELNRQQKMWLMSHELMHEIFATNHGEGGELMFPTLPSLNDNTKIRRVSGINYYYTSSDIELLGALESAWQFVWDNHCIKDGMFMVLRTLRQTKGLD